MEKGGGAPGRKKRERAVKKENEEKNKRNGWLSLAFRFLFLKLPFLYSLPIVSVFFLCVSVQVDKCAAVLRLACKNHKLIPLRRYSEVTMCAD